jgi:hypothetical protein
MLGGGDADAAGGSGHSLIESIFAVERVVSALLYRQQSSAIAGSRYTSSFYI